MTFHIFRKVAFYVSVSKHINPESGNLTVEKKNFGTSSFIEFSKRIGKHWDLKYQEKQTPLFDSPVEDVKLPDRTPNARRSAIGLSAISCLWKNLNFSGISYDLLKAADGRYSKMLLESNKVFDKLSIRETTSDRETVLSLLNSLQTELPKGSLGPSCPKCDKSSKSVVTVELDQPEFGEVTHAVKCSHGHESQANLSSLKILPVFPKSRTADIPTKISLNGSQWVLRSFPIEAGGEYFAGQWKEGSKCVNLKPAGMPRNSALTQGELSPEVLPRSNLKVPHDFSVLDIRTPVVAFYVPNEERYDDVCVLRFLPQGLDKGIRKSKVPTEMFQNEFWVDPVQEPFGATFDSEGSNLTYGVQGQTGSTWTVKQPDDGSLCRQQKGFTKESSDWIKARVARNFTKRSSWGPGAREVKSPSASLVKLQSQKEEIDRKVRAWESNKEFEDTLWFQDAAKIVIGLGVLSLVGYGFYRLQSMDDESTTSITETPRKRSSGRKSRRRSSRY
eukprot:GHVP01070951.1.p1 GENE.GHVP01070951.1~~GHVP01070951.1.p1  ORF type:complete len:503 (-),score=90.54 GHVP01070951.1:504-2012(-)